MHRAQRRAVPPLCPADGVTQLRAHGTMGPHEVSPHVGASLLPTQSASTREVQSVPCHGAAMLAVPSQRR